MRMVGVRRYAGGLLLAYMVFVPLSEAGSIDGPSIQVSNRLLDWNTIILRKI